jgi:hypothetical protein
VLYASDERVTSLYLSTTVLGSLVHTTVDGMTAVMGLIGNDGTVGVPLLGGTTIPHWAIVQVAGDAFQIATSVLHAA